MQVLALTEKVCAKLPFVSNECNALVEEYGHYYLEILAGTINVEQLCVKAGLCSADVRHMIEATELFQIIVRGLKESEGCKACTDGMDIIQTVLNSKDTLDLINIAVHELCSLTSIGECEVIADLLVDKIVKQLVDMFNPDTVCKEIGACAAAAEKVVVVEMSAVTPACEACTDALGELKKVANDPETKIIITNAVEVICETITIPFCNRVITKLIESQLEKIEILDVNADCIKLGACSTFSPFESFLVKENSVEEVGDTCSECTMIASEIITLIENESVDGLIKEAITEVCTLLPIANCEATIDGYFDQIVALLKNLDAKTICGLIGLCGSKAPVAPVVPALALGDTCSECAMIADLLLNELKDPTIQAEVEAAIDQACVVLPIPNCKATIHSYMVIAESFIATIDGKTVCGYAGLCSFGDAMEWF